MHPSLFPLGRTAPCCILFAFIMSWVLLSGSHRRGSRWSLTSRSIHEEYTSVSPPLCRLSLSDLVDPGLVNWTISEQHPELTLNIRNCELLRFSHTQAKQLLAGKRVVLIGDSLSRYQYLSLVHFLQNGRLRRLRPTRRRLNT